LPAQIKNIHRLHKITAGNEYKKQILTYTCNYTQNYKHAQKNGQVENTMPPAAHRIGDAWREALSSDQSRDESNIFTAVMTSPSLQASAVNTYKKLQICYYSRTCYIIRYYLLVLLFAKCHSIF